MRLGLGLGIDKNRVLGGGPAYTPAQDADLFDWWDAQANVTDDGTEMTDWTGSVNSLSAAPPTVTSRPLYGSDTINSLDVMTYRVGGNFVRIDCTSLGASCCIYIVIDINTTANAAIVGDPNSGSRVILSASGSASTADFGNNFGGNINYYSGTSLVGNNITRGQLYTASSTVGVLVFDNIDLSSVTNLDFFAQNGGFASAAVGGDIIISSGNTFRTENITFLKDKYAI